MKCPKCGAEIREGYLYCEKCGEDIHIVPDFDPEIEYSMHETLSGIVEEVREQVPDSGKEERERLRKAAAKRKRITLFAGVASLVLVVAVVAGILIVGQLRYHSVSYQITKANSSFQAGDTEKAIGYFERALELEGDDNALRFTLAELYSQCGREGEYVDMLFAVIRSGTATEEELAAAYKRIIAYYANLEDYASINTILMNTENDAIRIMFQNYMALPPEFSYQEGTYDKVVPLKLTSATQGTIYYTTDGTVPDETSEVYMTPIFLEAGSHTVSALFVNAYGIASEVVAKTYVIDVAKPPAPEVETYSGEYTTPVLIEVQLPMDGEVYYTTDGTIPTEHSAQYTEPIPMPLGKSEFKFITYSEEGVCGDCTTREFELKLDTESTPEQAVDTLVMGLVETGRLENTMGKPTGGVDGRYLYLYQYVLALPEQGDFYMVAEVFEDSIGVQNRTGTVYAVNVYTLECFKVIRGALDDYILEPIHKEQE